MNGQNSWDVDGDYDRDPRQVEPIIDYGDRMQVPVAPKCDSSNHPEGAERCEDCSPFLKKLGDELRAKTQIERTARTVAEALGDVYAHGPTPSVFSRTNNTTTSCADYLSDHRTLARYFVHSLGHDGDLSEVFDKLWMQALTNPTAAIIALVESVGGEG